VRDSEVETTYCKGVPDPPKEYRGKVLRNRKGFFLKKVKGSKDGSYPESPENKEEGRVMGKEFYSYRGEGKKEGSKEDR
jgi:hypothetical protein